MKVIIVSCMFMTILFLSSCANNVENIQADISGSVPQSFKRNTLYQDPEKISGKILPEDIQHNEAERGKKIVSTIRTMDNIEKASVVVNNNVAIVGIIVPDGLTDNELIGLKKDIKRRVKEIDSNIERTTVTSTPSLTEELSNISGDITNGVPPVKFNDELEHILTKITPAI